MTVETEDKLASARQQARAQFESIKEMVEALRRCDDVDVDLGEREMAGQTIHEDALSVEVRGDWHIPGDMEAGMVAGKPAEYKILLCTGGPAVQIVGKLSEHCEPETAELQCQDWFTPWTYVRLGETGEQVHEAEQVLLTYARCFYYGE